MPQATTPPGHTLLLDGASLTIDAAATFLSEPVSAGGRGFALRIDLTPAAWDAVGRARALVDELLKSPTAVYGINTGFGKLANARIAPDKLDELQVNLVRSHACGVGQPLPLSIVRLAMLLRVNSLARGHSGVRPEVIKQYTAMLAAGVTPWVPSRGSVGASGDLAPLSHVALAAIGEGRAYHCDELMDAGAALKRAGLMPLTLKAKEGLALINGTQFIQAIGLISIISARKLVKLADVAAALSLEALRGTDRAFDPRIANIRPHPGHAAAAANVRKLLAGSQIRESHRENDPRVQDAYSLRCVPQVHGAVRDALTHACEVFTREMNSVTDNPLVFPATATSPADIISGGNFHGEPVALPLDYLAIGLAELGSISERRIESMVNPDLAKEAGLPPFLSHDAGLNSGMMIAQVTAAALVSENKTLCHPASVDSIPTSANKEDHVSMGVWAALKLADIARNVRQVLEIELLCARYGMAEHVPLKTGPLLERAYHALARAVPPLARDRITYQDFEAVRAAVDSGALDGVFAELE